MSEQEEFRQHLRRLAVSAVQVLLEQVMREELEQCIGASWGGMSTHAPGVLSRKTPVVPMATAAFRDDIEASFQVTIRQEGAVDLQYRVPAAISTLEG